MGLSEITDNADEDLENLDSTNNSNSVMNSDSEVGDEEESDLGESGDETEEDDDAEENDETDGDDEDSDDDEIENVESQESLDTDKQPLSPNSIPTCYVCLNEFQGQEVGSPDSCEDIHHFCLECIEEWSKQINTCPVDRKSFSFILVKRDLGGDVIMKLPVKKKSVLEIETIDEDLTYCEICGRCDREDRLLLCDGCDFGYHCECLSPPLETIPIDEWFCPDCFQHLFGDEIRLEARRRQTTTRRAIARTGASEAVRNRILARRIDQSSPAPSLPARNSSRPSTKRKPAVKRRKTKTRRRRKKTRKTTKRTSKTKKTTKRRRKYKRRTRKSKQSSQRLPIASVRSRIASRLGITCKSNGLMSMNAAPFAPTSELRSSVREGKLSMFGYELALNNPLSYGNEYEYESFDGDGVGLIARAHTNVSHSIQKNIKATHVPCMSSSIDILGEIMNSQEILHASSRDLAVARDGRIYLNKNMVNQKIQKCSDPNPQSPTSPTPTKAMITAATKSETNGSNTSPSANSNNNNNNNNSNSGNQNCAQSPKSTSKYSSTTSSQSTEGDISLVKPSPMVALLEDKSDLDLYSDIESVGDNKEDNGNDEPNDKKQTEKRNEKDTLPNCDKMEKTKLSESETAEIDIHASIDNETEPETITNVSKICQTKRRPSIKDLFGGDSEEDEEDADLKRLVTQQGSINVHYPIKMPILLKSNFINDKTKVTSESTDSVPISKKWIPIYPEPEKVKSNGPKWKAVGFSEEKSSKETNKSSITSRLGPLNDKPVKVIRELILPPPKSPPSEPENESLKTKKDTKMDSKERKPIVYSRDSEEKQTQQTIKPLVVTSKTDTSKSEDAEKKIRLCKHGRPMRDKPKEKTLEIEASSKRRSRSPSILFIEEIPVKESNNREKVIATKRLRMDEPEIDSDLNWKRLSSSSKNRNYRDGKTRDADLPYKDRNLKSETKSSRSLNRHTDARKESSRSDREKDRHRERDRDKERERERDKDRDKDRNRERDKMRDRTRHRAYEDESRTKHERSRRSRSWHKTDLKVETVVSPKRDERSSRRNETETIESQRTSSRSHKHHHHHHHNHRHKKDDEPDHNGHYQHHSHKSSNHEQTTPRKTTTAKKEPVPSSSSSSSGNNFSQSYTTLKSVDSKEIYADGDKIIINVNFKRETASTIKIKSDGNDNKISEIKNDINFIDESLDAILANENDNKHRRPHQQTEENRDNINNNNNNNVDILSPQSFDEYGHLGSENSISSPLPSDEPPLRHVLADDILKKDLSEEFNFLPRILQIKDTTTSPTDQEQSQSDSFLDDSFMPTPTQDESHSPIATIANTIRSSKRPKISNSIRSTSPTEEKDDFYDPELPLQSPDRDSLDNIYQDNMFDSPKSPVNQSNSITTNLGSKLTNFNSINFNQLLQFAKTINGQNILGNNNNNNKNDGTKPRDVVEIVDMDVDSPSPLNNSKPSGSSPLSNVKEIWDKIMSSHDGNNGQQSDGSKKIKTGGGFNVNDPPNSAVDMGIKDKYIKKLNRLERVVDEIKVSLKPYYQKHRINKEEYKEILRKAVPKVTHSKSGQINPAKIKSLVEAYVKKVRHLRRK